MYNVMIWYEYMVQNDDHNKVSYHLHHLITFCVCVWWEHLRSTLLAAFKYTIPCCWLQSQAVRYIPELIYLRAGSLPLQSYYLYSVAEAILLCEANCSKKI